MWLWSKIHKGQAFIACKVRPLQKTLGISAALVGAAGLCLALPLPSPVREAEPLHIASKAFTTKAKVKPQRVVSLNLCADQLLLYLADRENIAGLTSNVRNPDMSAVAEQVGSLHVLGNSAEELLKINPDLVIGMPASSSALMAVLPESKFLIFDLQYTNSFSAIRTQMQLMARLLGHPERGEAVIARMERDLAALPKPGAGKVAAYYQRRGYMTGTGTLIDDLMQRVGLVNLAAKLGKPPLSQLSIEEMVAAKPDFIIVEENTNRFTDQGTEMLHHPALRHIPRINLSESWTVCGGPAYVTAAQSLVQQIMEEQVKERK